MRNHERGLWRRQRNRGHRRSRVRRPTCVPAGPSPCLRARPVGAVVDRGVQRTSEATRCLTAVLQPVCFGCHIVSAERSIISVFGRRFFTASRIEGGRLAESGTRLARSRTACAQHRVDHSFLRGSGTCGTRCSVGSALAARSEPLRRRCRAGRVRRRGAKALTDNSL